ncbi:MAG TPA: class I SAM-dependent methyltransferase [Vicinamibacterales bacterium]|jgi:cyclopropane fatty-acyl-phospholipid synthase-like methyltransferase
MRTGFFVLVVSAAASVFAQTPGADVHYVPTPDAVVSAMLDLAQVTAADVVYDLGSGDGRIVIEAARRYGARAVGIELDPELNKRAAKNAQKAGVAGRVSFVRSDFFKTDLSEATVVTLFLSPNINARLQPKLRRELKPGARIVSHRFPMPPDWKPERDLAVKGTHVFLWTIR